MLDLSLQMDWSIVGEGVLLREGSLVTITKHIILWFALSSFIFRGSLNVEKTLAYLFLIVASISLLLGNFWFTYGIWPHSWVAFTLFGVGQVLLGSVWRYLDKDR